MNRYFLKVKSTLGCVYRGTQAATKNWDSKIRTRYAYYYKYCKIRENIVLYESYFGKGLLCNPYAIFLELLKNPQYKHLKHVWVLNNDSIDEQLQEKYRNCPNVVFVKRHSHKYLWYLCSAKYLINNVTFHNYFIKKQGQIYINTWHGIPLKTLGFDMPNGSIEVSNVLRNFLHTDYLISASPFLTEIYKKAYKLDGIYQGKIIEEGYPRLDLLTCFSRDEIFKKLQKHGVDADIEKKVILFAPTWRGKSYAEASTDVGFYFEFKRILEESIDTKKYQVLIKVHQRVYELAKDKLTEGYFIPSSIDANEVLSVTDILVSDFSSIYIDFLATGRPVLFYIPDLESYSVDRGLYRSPETLPGPCAQRVEDIADWVNRIEEISAQYQDKYDAERLWSNGYNAGTISQKIVDIVFNQNEEGYTIHRPAPSKKRLLISRGKMLVNGISSSLLSFLDNIDYTEFDVSVMISSSSKQEEKRLINRINPNARVFFRNSPGAFTIWERIVQEYYGRTRYKNVFHAMYARDAVRCYGNADFDYVLDFEGYNTYYAILCLQFHNARKSIWQHNDMLAERDAKFPWLENIFSLYKHFDRVVSCSQGVMYVNRENLAGTYCDAGKFCYMRNFIDIDRVNSSVGTDVVREYEGQRYILLSKAVKKSCLSLQLLPYIPEKSNNGARNCRFVTIGRCSVEKNHENLIQAFHMLYQENPNVYLYILGDGKLKKELDSSIAQLGLEEHIFAPGNIENPFAVLENCDCFILPSLHEGQPMVINEARMLKMPIIVSNFTSVSGVLVENGQLVIEKDSESIYKGMKAFINGEVPSDYFFDAKAYNQVAYQEFQAALSGRME